MAKFVGERFLTSGHRQEIVQFLVEAEKAVRLTAACSSPIFIAGGEISGTNTNP